MKISIACNRAGYIAKILLSATLAACAFNAHSAEYQHSYPVTGSTAEELIDQIDRNSHSPEGAFGYTKLNTNVGWTAVAGTDGTCEIESVSFTYDITIYMPDWTDKHTAKQCLQDNWDSAWLEIQLHEEQHRNIYRLLNIPDIEKRISSIKPKASCDAIKIAVNEEVEKILDINDLLHDAFHAADITPILWDC